MSITVIDTKKLPRQTTPQGQFSEILNYSLAAAKNVLATLRWLEPGTKFQVGPTEEHQLVYLMEGRGTIHLENKCHEVTKGAGVYLGPSEIAIIQASGQEELKLFCLLVPKSHE